MKKCDGQRPPLQRLLGLFDEVRIENSHLGINRFAHVVNREQRHHHSRERLHLYASLRRCARRALCFHAIRHRAECNVDVGEIEIVTKGDELRSLLCRLNPGDARDRIDVPFGDAILSRSIPMFQGAAGFCPRRRQRDDSRVWPKRRPFARCHRLQCE